MKQTDKISYLADILSEKATIDDTISSRRLKAIGIISQISTILKNVSLGMYYFRTALILRNGLLLNGILTNSEAWNFISQRNYKILEDCDIRLFSTLFESNNTNRVLFHLETSTIPIRHVIAKRRFLYLWHILSRKPNELISKVYEIQKVKPVQYDFYLLIQSEKTKYGIHLTDDEIKC